MSSSVQPSLGLAENQAPDGVSVSKAPSQKSARRQARLFGSLFYFSSVGALACIALLLPSVVAGMEGWLTALLAVALVGHGVSIALFAAMGRAQDAAVFAAVCFTVLLASAAALSGGMSSPLLVLFALAPIEVFLTHHNRAKQIVLGTTGLAVLITVLVPVNGSASFVIAQNQLIFISLLGILYAVSLAARIVRISSLKDVRAQAARRAIHQFHAVTHDMFLIMGRDGKVEQVFGAVDQILRCPGEALKQSGFLQRIHIADRPSVLSTIDRVHATGQRDRVEARLRAGEDDGHQHFIWAEIDMSVLQRSGTTLDVYALVRDISASKQRASELTLAREKAEASDAAKGRFLATMSHELRTPLNAIIGFADILDEEVFGSLANDQQREYVGLIRDSGGHLLQLVNDLLDMSKLDAGHFHIVAEPFALGTVIDRCTRLVGQQIEKAGLKLHVDLPEGMPELVADQRAIRQVLINLLSNASKFTPSGGSITLRARKDGSMLILSVIDTGIGIAAGDLSKIGQPFFQANNAYDRNHQGTGLGLSVVKGLCELHEGDLTISSVEGEGTTVTVRLPFAGPKGQAPTASSAVDQQVANTVVLAKLHNEMSKAQPAAVATTAGTSESENTIFEQEGQRAHG
ncbi:MAG: ATP-binding protein [Devosiaceae bacterium]